jgi:short-subunit dehydrogenase
MKLAGRRVLLTGATGGIGRALALELAGRGARLALLARDGGRLDALVEELRTAGAAALPLRFDLARREGHDAPVREAIAALEGLDVLINNAAISRFGNYVDAEPAAIARLIDVNVNGPLLLTAAALPHFLARGSGHIVNVGSILGSIGFPHFAVYSASKFALRGFSEALRRELRGSGVRVCYIAPRTTDTGLNDAAARALMSETGAAVDTPARVARVIAEAIEHERAEVFIGAAENIFVRLNALAARAVDRPLARQNRIAERLLRRGS